MKIVHVVYSLEMGGAEVIVGQLCRIQRAQGHDPSVFAYARLGVIGEALRAEGFEVYVPGEAHPLVTMRRYFQRFRALKPDVVHAHNVAPTTHAALPARLAGVPAILSTRHRMELHPYDRKGEMQYNLMGWFCHWVTGICEVTCDGIRNGLFANKRKIVCVYNGTEPVVRVPAEQLAPLGKRGFTLVFIGRLVKEKDLGTLLRAVAIARKQVPGLGCWIVGDGNVRQQLEALAAELDLAETVRFWGMRTDTAPFFSSADAFVMSSYSEGLPMSLLQSMSLGTPAILTDCDGIGEVVHLTQSGLLVPIGDHAAMAQAIVQLAGEPALQAQFSQRARDEYAARFTLEKMNQGYMELYQPGR